MTALRTSLALAMASLLAVAPSPARADGAAFPTVAQLLGLKPNLKGVECDTPTDAASLAACKVEGVTNAKKKVIGYAVRDGQGKLLRKFVDTHGDGAMDQWSYYLDGFEVYRESDLNKDTILDECRWLNSAGTRIASIARGKIVGWKRISAEEASKVFVAGLLAGSATGDYSLLESVMATPEELAALAVPKGEVEAVAHAAAQRAEQVRALQKGLVGWNAKTVWNRLDGMMLMPHLIPADALSGTTQDLLLYENAAIFAGPAGGQTTNEKVAFLQVPEMIKVGECWKFVELPKAVDPEKPVIASEGGIRSWVFRQQRGAAEGGSPEVEAALKQLADYDNANAKVQIEGGKKELAQFHRGRIPLLRAVVKVVGDPEEKLSYDKQVVDSLAAAYQTGFFNDGLKLLDAVIAENGKAASYAAFRKVSVVFATKNEEPGTNLMANQKEWMTDLKGFLQKYPDSDSAPDALLQLASASEFNAEEDEARKFYEQLAKNYPESDAGKKAAGAIRRLELVGKAIDLKGPTLNGQVLDTARLKGKTYLVTFWASWADPVRRDLPELVKLYKAYKGKNFEIVGVNLDNERADLDAFLKENPLPWVQIFEPGGIEKSPYATGYGIIALPTMVLVDSTGKVVNRNIRTAAELERQLEKLFGGAGEPKGVALER